MTDRSARPRSARPPRLCWHHALDCACAPCCALLSQAATEPERASTPRYLREVKIEVPVQEGDHVWVESGEYQGALLTLLRRDALGWYVCARSSPPFEIRIRRVSLYRRLP